MIRIHWTLRGRVVRLALAASAAAVVTPSPGRTQQPAGQPSRAESAERVLLNEAVLNAPVDSVWRTLTTAAGLRTFLAPVVAMDFRIDGRWETSYDMAGKLGDSTNIVNEIVAYRPAEMFAVRIVHAPPRFAHAELARRLVTVYTLQSASENTTRLIVTMVGWGAGADWDELYHFFERGNAVTMNALSRRFAEGPRTWRRPL